jgi:hypothetical protein
MKSEEKNSKRLDERDVSARCIVLQILLKSCGTRGTIIGRIAAAR